MDIFYLYQIVCSSLCYLAVVTMAVPKKISSNAMNMRLLHKKLESLESTISFAVTCPYGSYIDNYKIQISKKGWRRPFFQCKQKGCAYFVDCRYGPFLAVDLVIWTLNSCRFDDLEIGVDGDLASLKL